MLYLRIISVVLILLGTSCSRAPDTSSDESKARPSPRHTNESTPKASADESNTPAKGFPSPSAITKIPVFDLPAPTPSTRTTIPAAPFTKYGFALDTVADAISATLEKAGYEDEGFFQVAHGFALATRMERIHNDGSPYLGSNRFRTEPTGLLSIGFTFKQMYGSLLDADPGRYRVIVFVVTDVPVAASGTGMSAKEAQTIVVRGVPSLPEDYHQLTMTPSYRITALIYEFRRESSGAEPQVIPSEIQARTQLRLAGII